MRIEAALPLDELRAVLCARVNSIRAERLSRVFSFGGVGYDCDERSISNLTAMVSAINAGIPVPDGFVWRSADNQDIPHDAASLTALAGAMVAYRSAVYANSFRMKDAINAATNPASVDVTAGWPA